MTDTLPAETQKTNSVDQAARRRRIAEALYAHSHPGWALSLRDSGTEPTYLARAAAVLAVLPDTRPAALHDAADDLDANMEHFFTEHPEEPRNSPYVLGWRYATSELRRLAGETRTEEQDPARLRWGLNDVMWGDDDSVIVMLSGPDGEPYSLELDPDRAAVLRQDLAGPDSGKPDTLPAWLRRRFTASAVPWEQLDDVEQSYWTHQANAVRGAVARNGFRAAAEERTASKPETEAVCVCGHPTRLHHEDACLQCSCGDSLETSALPEALEAILTKRFTKLGNQFAEMRVHEQGPDGWPSSRLVSPRMVAEALQELMLRPAAGVRQDDGAQP